MDKLTDLLTDTKRRTLSDYVSGKSEPRASVLLEISRVTSTNLSWLLSGMADDRNGYIPEDLVMPPSERTSRDLALSAATGIPVADLPMNRKVARRTDDFIRIPQYDIEASAGPGALPDAEQVAGVVSFEASFLRNLGATPDQCSAIWAKGDSMEPTIPDGCLVIVDHSQSAVKNGCIYVLNIGGDLLVKRVRRRLDDTIELVSDNNRYPIETVAADRVAQLRVIGRVVYLCREP
ncbi:S24 family peptidase [Puniceibacterium sp. IMCC21224]|uniref:S24 family peptidase n=1 Tax=Puniceibacterium sp. IMCC21224 TaxID=1618204 RepID=UPI001E3A3AA9|nr:S24 family peptidase [Puniceibacterium sp. IMCC21224]